MASWNYTVHKINESFERIVDWYKDFMHRTEKSFRDLHHRLLYLEEREPWQGPSDEQVERVLRKILAEKFANHDMQGVERSNTARENIYFVEKPSKDFVAPKPIPIEAGLLEIDPNGVPSKAYAETFKMLENKLTAFPNVNVSKSARDVKLQDIRTSPISAKAPLQPSNTHLHDRPWQ